MVVRAAMLTHHTEHPIPPSPTLPPLHQRQPTWSSLVPGAGLVEKQDTTLLNILSNYRFFGLGLFYFEC
jgi:hypothetical protein